MNPPQLASRTRLMLFLVLLSILEIALLTGAVRAQKAEDLLPAPLPETFTITYTVVSKDVRTDAMRESERQFYREYWLRMVQRKEMTEQELEKTLAADEQEFKHPSPTKESLLTLSCDGGRLLCVTKNKDGKDTSIGIYSADENKTYYAQPHKYGRLPQAYKGFNYSAMRCIPLLPYSNPKLGLFFLKEGVSASSSLLAPNSKDSASGNAVVVPASKWTWTSKSPITRSQFVNDTEIPYGLFAVTLARVNNRVEVQQCVGYYDDQKAIASDWTYSHYVTKMGVRLPANIAYWQYNTFTVKGVKQELPKTEFDYTLVSARFEPMDSDRFDMRVWAKEIEEAAQEEEENKKAAEAKQAGKAQTVPQPESKSAAKTPSPERTTTPPTLSKPELPDPKALALWREVMAATKTVRTLSATLTLSIRVEDGGTNTDTGKVFLQKPNLARIALPTVWGDSMTVASDGKRSWQMMSDPEPIRTVGESPYVFREVPADPQGHTIQAAYTFAIPFFFNPEQSPATLVGSMFEVDRAGEPRYIGKETLNGQECDVLEQPITQPIPYTMRAYIGSDKLLRRVIVVFPKNGDAHHAYYFVADLSGVVVDRPIPPATFAYTPPKDARPYVAQPQTASTLTVGQPAPDFTMQLLNGETQTLTDALKGKKAIYLDFWFVDCLTCRHEFPHLQKLYAALKAQGLEIIALDCGDELAAVRKAMQTLDYLKPATFTIGLTGTGKPQRTITKQYGVDGYPTGILIGANGKIAFISYGFEEKSGLSALQTALQKLGIKPLR